mmetsp:Transcript_78801/g.142140  ORF Transcript_78801/g.142140 Transcript_78801/m.142140 type:complete len:222 (+) Transcript_78801:61-726(+)
MSLVFAPQLGKWLLAVACLIFLCPTAESSSEFVANLCRGGVCDNPAFPILDYDPDEQRCICRAHPCWNDHGVTHACPSVEFPYLHFRYTENTTLQCSCSNVPNYDSLHVARTKCPGHWCDKAKFSILDWSPDEEKCFCRSHPCLGDDKQPHECPDPSRPILLYRLGVSAEGADEPICECVAKLDPPPSRGLRGASEPPPESCTFVAPRRTNSAQPGLRLNQ